MSSSIAIDLDKVSRTANVAHLSYLGLVVDDDGGRLVAMLALVFICASYVLVSRRREIPMVGETM